MRSRARVLLLFLAVLAGAAGCDHATKRVALSTLDGAGRVSLAGDAVRLELAANPGAFLGLGAGLPEGLRDVLLLVAVPAVLLLLCARLLGAGAPSRALAVGLGLVAGGGLANWLDRLLHGGTVTDFLAVGVGPLRTGIFNVADVAVVAGVAVLLLFTRRAP